MREGKRLGRQTTQTNGSTQHGLKGKEVVTAGRVSGFVVLRRYCMFERDGGGDEDT